MRAGLQSLVTDGVLPPWSDSFKAGLKSPTCREVGLVDPLELPKQIEVRN
jgi:hypothetical protein